MTTDGKDSGDAAIPKPAEEDSLRTSPSLLQAAISGNHQAWSRIVEIYSDRIFAKCRKSSLSETDSAEVVHEVFVSLWNNREKFQIRSQPGSFRAWLATVTFREVCNLHRDRQKPGRNAVGGSVAAEQIANLPAVEALSAEHFLLDRQEVLGRVLSVLRAEIDLEGRDFRIFQRHKVDGLEASEVAGEFDVTANHVRVISSRLLKKIRTLMEEHDVH